MGKFVIKNTATGIKFDLKATNGQVVASSQVYKSLSNAKSGIDSVIRNAPIAELEDQTKENYKVEKHPKFEIYKDKAGEYRFRLKAKNGQIVAVSEGYKKIESCLNGIDSTKKNSVDAEIIRE